MDDPLDRLLEPNYRLLPEEAFIQITDAIVKNRRSLALLPKIENRGSSSPNF
jgi:hypothetical protein